MGARLVDIGVYPALVHDHDNDGGHGSTILARATPEDTPIMTARIVETCRDDEERPIWTYNEHAKWKSGPRNTTYSSQLKLLTRTTSLSKTRVLAIRVRYLLEALLAVIEANITAMASCWTANTV